MNAHAHRIDPLQAVQELATVVTVAGDLRVRTGAGVYRATRAVSCLVAPRVDDLVLVATTTHGECYVLAVLRREGEGATEISAEGQLDIVADRVDVVGREGVGLTSGRDVGVTAGRLRVNAVDGEVALQRLSFVGRFVQSEVEKIKTFAGALDQVLDRFSQRVKRSYRNVEEVDHLKAKQVDYRAEETMALHGSNTAMTADHLVKVDGDQIHVG